MDHYKQLLQKTQRIVFGWLCFMGFFIIGVGWLAQHYINENTTLITIYLAIFVILFCALSALLVSRRMLEPLHIVWQAIVHVSADSTMVNAPNLDSIKVGRQLVTNLVLQVYQMASAGDKDKPESLHTGMALAILQSMPLPLLALDKDRNIVFINETALQYIGQSPNAQEIKNLDELSISFSSEETLERWLAVSTANTVTASHTWNRVRLSVPSQTTPKQFDLAASYSKDNPSGIELILVMFDHTAQYTQEDDDVSFVALAVHELRTPLTILRGYIEVLDDELSGKLDPELADFMAKMQASAQQLGVFFNNILNVARVEQNQLVLKLAKTNWGDVLQAAIADLQLRAQVRNRSIEVHIPSDLPIVATDSISIVEVVINLIDNAIKYSHDGGKIVVRVAVKQDGMVETTIQDFGVGIPESVMPHLFDRFYRSHRTNASVGGTGLGLYLSKAIIGAHGGEIWVDSHESVGTTVGFTIRPYAQLADESKNSNNEEVTRSAHGWIKNHSLYRR